MILKMVGTVNCVSSYKSWKWKGPTMLSLWHVATLPGPSQMLSSGGTILTPLCIKPDHNQITVVAFQPVQLAQA